MQLDILLVHSSLYTQFIYLFFDIYIFRLHVNNAISVLNLFSILVKSWQTFSLLSQYTGLHFLVLLI